MAIYWSNHHHLLQAVKQVNGPILWANSHLLFWLSLVPFTTAWMGENRFAPVPVVFYGLVLLAAACAYFILVRSLISHHGRDSTLARAIGSDRKGKISIVFYLIAIAVSCISPLAACAIYVWVAIMWIIPDRRIEKVLES